MLRVKVVSIVSQGFVQGSGLTPRLCTVRLPGLGDVQYLVMSQIPPQNNPWRLLVLVPMCNWGS